MSVHPDLAAEQAYLDHAYRCLEDSRRAAAELGSTMETGRGGTFQAQFERDVMSEARSLRMEALEFGDAALCFGRIDQAQNGGPGAVYYIGRVGVSDADKEPVVVDWRAPVAEPFYRATGGEPMGLERRRHFATRGRTLLDIEDELFGELARSLDDVDASGRRRPIQGHGALITALETARTGRLSDIVGTIQAEQDEIIRAPLPGVLVVQGGPGTGKTVVALHRAAYLLYTHRFPLEGQGVLVVGPNRLFLNYIERVLPALGEAGIDQVVLADLVPEQRVGGPDHPRSGRIKGDLAMVRLLRRAVRQRQQALRGDLEVGFGVQILRVRAEQSSRIVAEARRRFRRHNAARRFVESELFAALARSAKREVTPDDVRAGLRRHPEVRAALEWMWPVLTPAELLNDLFGSPGLLRSACRGLLAAEGDWELLARTRAVAADDVVWASDDVPLLDEARSLLGPPPRPKGKPALFDDEPRTYGHIVVDEAQDLSPMQLRMLSRRSLNGSLTVVGDIAQATGAWAHASWDEILDHLPERRPPRTVELTVGYRIPAPLMRVAAHVLEEAAPELSPPESIREDGDPPRFVDAGGNLGSTVARVAAEELEAVAPGSVAVICPTSMVDELDGALAAAGIEASRATRHGLDTGITLVPVSLVKGLELDAAVVVEPLSVLEEEAQGVRALYVALTRATKRVAIVHDRPLPSVLARACDDRNSDGVGAGVAGAFG